MAVTIWKVAEDGCRCMGECGWLWVRTRVVHTGRRWATDGNIFPV